MLQTIVRLNPVSLTITAMRTILRTGHWGPDAFGVLLSGFLIIVIFMPLTVLAYRRFG
ncbi:ABC-type multidrug transport system permeasecomponent [Lactiplantibacillus plantarum]|nr:ABC-type multidrug transport system permeasecomponent [Lactiplantibacillus plantarum]KZU29008.1 ABC-type multidrug transport system permeasecomponent [Lactiplantibacillus plantarum]